MSYCIVEFHGFRDENNGWIIKELAIVGHFFTYHTIYKSPYSKDRITSRKTRNSIAWLEYNYHGIRWEDGIIPFEFSTLKRLMQPFGVVYTKGLEKKEYLSRSHTDVREIETNVIDGPSVQCCLPQHIDNKKCALRNATMYFEFFDKKM